MSEDMSSRAVLKFGLHHCCIDSGEFQAWMTSQGNGCDEQHSVTALCTHICVLLHKQSAGAQLVSDRSVNFLKMWVGWLMQDSAS